MQTTNNTTNNNNKNQKTRQPYLIKYDAGFDWINTPVIIITKKDPLNSHVDKKPIQKMDYFSEAFLIYDFSQPPQVLKKVEFSIEKTLEVFDKFLANTIEEAAVEKAPTSLLHYKTLRFSEAGYEVTLGMNTVGWLGAFRVLETLKIFKMHIPQLKDAVIENIMVNIFRIALKFGCPTRFFAKIYNPTEALKMLMENQEFKKDVLIPFWINMLKSLIYDWYLHVKKHGKHSKSGLDGIEINLDGLLDLENLDQLFKIFKKRLKFKNIQVK